MNSSQSEFDYNTTLESDSDDAHYLDFILIAFGAFGAIANGFVLFVIGFVKDLQSGTNLLIANQSLIDFVTSVFLLVLQVVPASLPTNLPGLAKFICAFWISWNPFYITIAASVANLVLITIERFYAIMSPIQYRQNMGTRRLALLATIPWIYGFCFEAHSYAWVRVEGNACYIFQWPSDKVRQGIGIFLYVLNFLVPTFIIALLYSLMAVKLKHGPKAQSNQDSYRDRARRNIIKTLLIVCICYVVCWAPLDNVHFYDAIGGTFNFSGEFYKFAIIMAFANMWINPVIYSLRYQRFQAAVVKLFCKREPARQPQTVSTVATGSKV
ncbi:allatostatin-A receptor-like [Diadema setosum]|uniref:allatostatin-A receptor-like n=1 Tax=Diadema setosum TaxID=31175 RepID=UPI003B3ACE1B